MSWRALLPRQIAIILLASLLVGPANASAASAERPGAAGPPAEIPSIEDKTAGMEKRDGLFPLYWDADVGTLWLEIPHSTKR